MSLRECRYPGRVQLLGRCESAFLENFRRAGADASLAMLPVLQKPVDFAAIRKIVLEQKLICQPVAAHELSLKTAIARDYVTFWYQPKIDLKLRQVVGAEAFARIAHPQHGILSPARFLAGAAEEDLLELANRALVSALQLSARLYEVGIPLQIAINLNIESIMKLPISELMLKHRPQQAEAWPGILFDVSETQVLNKITVLREKFHELGKYGISLAIDNFGRGNSSFSLFRYLQFSEIKIDTSFVAGLREQCRELQCLQEHDPDCTQLCPQSSRRGHRDRRGCAGAGEFGLRRRPRIHIRQADDGPAAHDHGHGRPRASPRISSAPILGTFHREQGEIRDTWATLRRPETHAS